MAVPRSLWVFGHLVCGGRSGDRAGWACVWRATASQQVAMVRLRVAASRRASCVGGEPATGLRGRPVANSTDHRLLCLYDYRHDVSIRIVAGAGRLVPRRLAALEDLDDAHLPPQHGQVGV